MSYIPTNWQTGDIVTAEKMNKIEGGIQSSGALVVLIENNDGYPQLQAPAQTITDAMINGRPVFAYESHVNQDASADWYIGMDCSVSGAYGYQIVFLYLNGAGMNLSQIYFHAAEGTDYPICTQTNDDIDLA